MIDAAARHAAGDGYAGLTVAGLLAAAGVARGTFYQCFASVDDCFWAAYRQAAEGLLAAVERGIGSVELPELGALPALVEYAVDRPGEARLLLREGLASGPAGLRERDALIERIAGAIATTTTASVCERVDVPVELLIGGVCRFLTMRLQEGAVDASVAAEVSRWARAFLRPAGSCWGFDFAPPPPGERDRLDRPDHAPPPRSPPRPIAGSSRERIMRAAVAKVREKGYARCTIEEIASCAGVSRRGFYNEFPDKAGAVIAAYELGFAQTLAECAPAFFGAAEWPEQVWRCAQAFTGYFEREPGFAHLGFVECYALGPGFTRRVHETQLAFTIFLEEGYRQSGHHVQLPRSCSMLIAASVAEAGFLASRGSPGLYIRRMQPLAAYLTLAPFIGSERAGWFVTDKLAGRSAADQVAVS